MVEKEEFERKLNSSLEAEEKKGVEMLNQSQERTNELENELKVLNNILTLWKKMFDL